MNIVLTVAALLLPSAQIDTRFQQVGPVQADGQLVRSPNQTRAVLLLHGFVAHFKEANVSKAAFRPWQVPESLLVKTLAKEADVFSFGYSQNVALDDIVKAPGLADAVDRLKKLGYREIVLLGHSAGGLVARQFVEDHPDSGVTKVIQVCAPNGGTPSAKVMLTRSQQVFLDCLTEESRRKCLEARKDKRIPDGVEFVCVMGRSESDPGTDGVVPCPCQWTPDLQKQGIPVLALTVFHHESTRTPLGVTTLAKLVREKQPRWKPEQIEVHSKELFKK